MRRVRAGRDAAPAGSASSAGHSGGLGAPPYGHYDPCAGSQLDHRSKAERPRSGRQARPEVRAASLTAPHQNAAVKRRKARRPA